MFLGRSVTISEHWVRLSPELNGEWMKRQGTNIFTYPPYLLVFLFRILTFPVPIYTYYFINFQKIVYKMEQICALNRVYFPARGDKKQQLRTKSRMFSTFLHMSVM